LTASLSVSVVIPSLDQARFLSTAIDSVLGQDHRPLELIVMDGGSRDGTIEVLRGHGRALRWVSAPDAGQAAAINAGWRSSSGDVIAWLNADDAYLPGAVSAAVGALQADRHLDVVYGDGHYWDEQGRFLRVYPTEAFDYARLLGRAVCFIPQPATFLRRRVFEAEGGLDESLHYALDLEYWLRLGAAGRRFRHLPVALAALRLHPAAKSIRHLAAFGPEVVGIYEGLARRGSPAIDPSLLRRGLSSAHYRASQCLFWSGRFSEARAHAWRSWRLAPLRVRPLLAAAMGGTTARAMLERWRGNPFTAGVGPA
jgi:glycosyltransferase involved in cell wall biosynthesis